MKNKKICLLLLVLLLVLNTFISQNTYISASALDSTGLKQLKINDTTLEFNEIIYVDGTNGNDETGDGTIHKPFKSMVKGFDYMSKNCREDGAIVVKEGSYNVSGLFKSSNGNLNPAYNKMKISIIAETLGTVEFLNSMEWQVTQNNSSHRIKLKMYGIRIKSSTHGHLGADNWINEYYNCLFDCDYGGENLEVSNAAIYLENCLFLNNKNSCYNVYPISGTAVNCASTIGYIEPKNGIKKNILYNVTVDKEFNITSTGWENTGEGKNPDGSNAHIGVYGNQFAWGSKVKEEPKYLLQIVMEVKERLQLSVDKNLIENINMIWTSSDSSIANVDEKGMVMAENLGETIITVISKDGKYTETISILVVENADDYRLAVDLNVGESCRATIDKNKQAAIVDWSVADVSIATISSKGKITAQREGLTYVTAKDINGNIIGIVYVRVR